MKSKNPCPVCGCRSKWYYFLAEYDEMEKLLYKASTQDFLIIENKEELQEVLVPVQGQTFYYKGEVIWDYNYCESCNTIFTGTL